MIDELSIHNLGIIRDASLTLGAGMTVITGETGAGKTMLLTSLKLLMGARSDASKIGAFDSVAQVQGVFAIPAHAPVVQRIGDAGCLLDDVEVEAHATNSSGASKPVVSAIVSRRVLSGGRSKAVIGAGAVPIALLREVSSELFTIHGQADQMRLGAKSEQRRALDDFAHVTGSQVQSDYFSAWEAYNLARQALAEAQENQANYATQRLALEALVTRVEAVNPQPGEDDELRARAHRLENLESYRSALESAIFAIDGSEGSSGVLTEIGAVEKTLQRSGDPGLAELAALASESQTLLSELSAQLNTLLADCDFEPDEINAIYERRAQIAELERELAMDVPTILEKYAQACTQLADAVNPQQRIAALQAQVDQTYEDLLRAAKVLSAQRKRAADRLAKVVTQELQGLAMKDAKFAVEIRDLEQPAAHGRDDVEFMLAPHKGAQLQPLGATASGGEMSRVMLALEVALAAEIDLPAHTFIFDEIDAGIGGETALQVGRRLAKLAQHSQVIVVTHLAQVAAFGDHHLVVEKSSHQDNTTTEVSPVVGEARVWELARMLSGQADSAAARAHAAELLEQVSVGV